MNAADLGIITRGNARPTAAIKAGRLRRSKRFLSQNAGLIMVCDKIRDLFIVLKKKQQLRKWSRPINDEVVTNGGVIGKIKEVEITATIQSQKSAEIGRRQAS